VIHAPGDKTFMIRKILVGFLIVVAIAVIAVLAAYYGWRDSRYESLRTGSRVAETSAGPIEYVLRGEQGPVILFLHGAPGGYDQAPQDPPEGFRLLAPSRPGYLFTPLEVGRTPAEQARALAALLDSLQIERVMVIAVSAGGPSAISFAALYPERTTGLVAVEAISQPFLNEAETPAFLESDFLYWSILGAVFQISGAEGIVLDQVPDPENRQRILGDPDKLAEFARLMRSIGPPSLRKTGWRNDMEQFKYMTLPTGKVRAATLVIHGKADALVPFLHSKRLARQIPGARFHVIEGGDHFMPISHKEEIDQVIESFLRECLDRAGDG
jgi:pimeloyl-ACP methyl ester carboxylesterase